MFRRLFSFLFYLLFLAIIASALTAAWIIYDGLHDQGQRADVALVPGHEDAETGNPGPLIQARLDRAIALYQADQVSHILVSGGGKLETYDEPSTMVRYLEQHGVPSHAIIGIEEETPVVDELGIDTPKISLRWAAALKGRSRDSIMIVTQYYQITRWKWALQHAGVTQIEQAHVGSLDNLDETDAINIGHEVIALYTYLATSYLMPEAKTLSEKAKVEGDQAKDTIDKKLDSLSK